MRRILQASLLCTCISSTLALGCRNSQHCCTPCCYPSAAGQPVPAAPTPVPTAAPTSAPTAAPVSSQDPAAPAMPLVQNGSPAAAPTNPPIPLPSEVSSADNSAPSSPVGTPGQPLPAGQPSAALRAQASQEMAAAPQAVLTPAQQPAGAEESAQAGSFYHDPAYHSLVGVLDYVAIQKGWVLRFTAPEEEDRYGGCVTLVGTGSMKGFHRGQRVQVSGELVDADSLKPHPAYRVFSLQPLGPQG